MFERMRSGWRLAKQVRKSVSKDRSLYIFPVLSGIVGVLLFAVTFASLFITIPTNTNGSHTFLYVGGFILAYVIVGFSSTYFLVAMLIAYRAYSSSSPIGMGEAFSRAWAYKVQILEWALFYTILVMILRVIESRFRGIVQLAIGVVGSFMIAIATFFAIPAILAEKLGPIKAVEKSVGTIRSNFGMTFGGVTYVDIYTLGFILGGFFLFIISLVFLVGITGAFLGIVLAATGIVIMAFGIILNYTYMNVLKLILFDYLNGGGLPDGFNENDIKNSIRKRRQRRSRSMSAQNDEFGLQ